MKLLFVKIQGLSEEWMENWSVKINKYSKSKMIENLRKCENEWKTSGNKIHKILAVT